MTLQVIWKKQMKDFHFKQEGCSQPGSRRDGHRNNEGATSAAPHPHQCWAEVPTGSGRKVMGMGRWLLGGCCGSQGRKEGLIQDPELPRPLLSPP